MKVPAQAALQRRVLASLAERQAESVVALANRLDVSRPSASRALKRLLQRELVMREGRRWSLSPAGHAEAERVITGVPAGLARALKEHAAFQRSLAADIDRIGTMPAFTMFDGALRMAELVDASPLRMFGSAATDAIGPVALAAPGLRSFDPAALGISKIHASALAALDGAAADSIAGFTARLPATARGLKAFTAAAELQRMQVDAIVGGLAAPAWREVIGINQSIAGRLMADVAVLLEVARGAQLGLLGNALLNATERLVPAAASHAASVIAEIDDGRVFSRSLGRELLEPSRTTAMFVAGARGLLESPRRRQRVNLDDETTLVAEQLRAVDPDAGAAWEAAWQALDQLRPGWARTAAHQGRESIRLLLARLAPDEAISSGGERVTRRMRILYVMRDRRPQYAEWADAQAAAGLSSWEILNREAHAPRLDPAGMGDVLSAMGGLMMVLIRIGRFG